MKTEGICKHLSCLELQESQPEQRRLVVGLTGYPNVGKSSTINALFGTLLGGFSTCQHLCSVPPTCLGLLCRCAFVGLRNTVNLDFEMQCERINRDGTLPSVCV